MGNKAENLKKLTKWGLRVPPFIVLEAGLGENEFHECVRNFVQRFRFYAVRSSASNEDSLQESKAGYFYTAIGVSADKLFHAYTKVVASYNGLLGQVIIQEFIPTAQAGVMFTNSQKNQIHINSTLGLCKAVVEGMPCDEFIIDLKGNLKQRKVAKQKQCMFFEQGTLESKSSTDVSLAEKQLKRLAAVAKKIEGQARAPQDIEWGFYKEKLYIFQTRPVTRDLPELKEAVYYDSANIAESYSGIIKPLTISFAKHVYQVVYRNLLFYSGVPAKKLNKNQHIFSKMLDTFYGRLYYNMNNWYKMSSFLPGYKRNKQNLEDMITSNVKASVERDIEPTAMLKISYPFILIGKLIMMGRTQNNFRMLVKNYIDNFRKIDINSMQFKDCKALFEDMDRKLIRKWHIPVENDFMVMSYYGILKKRFSDDELNNLIRFKSKSTEQVETLAGIHAYIASRPGLMEMLRQEKEEALFKDEGLNRLLNNYFVEFGGRFANELKLESEDLEDDKHKLLQLLQLFGNIELPEYGTSGKQIKLNLADRFLLKKFKHYASRREEMRLLRSNCFSLARKVFRRMGAIYAEKQFLENTDDIFYLNMDEVFNPNEKDLLKKIVQQRMAEYQGFEEVNPPAFFSSVNDVVPESWESQADKSGWHTGRGCSQGIVKGKVKVMPEYALPKTIDFEILIARHTDPGWTPLIALSKGLIVEHGGILSHAAIVAREMGIPTVVGVSGALNIFKNGQVVEMNGETGEIKIIHEPKD